MAIVYGANGPVEIASGRGDLRYTSTSFPNWVGGVPLTDGRSPSYARLYTEQIWVAICVSRLLTWSVKVPLKLYRRTGDNSRVRLYPKDHKLAAALATPWPRAGQIQLIMHLLGGLSVNGNATAEVLDGPKRMMFEPRDFPSAVAIPATRFRLSGWEFDEGDGEPITRTADQVLHAAHWSPNGPLGVSPLEPLGVTLQIEDAAQRWQVAALRNGGRPPSAIEVDEKFIGMEKDARKALLDKLREQVDRIYSGPENAGRPALLPPGLKWNPVGHTNVEAELVAQRKITREEAAARYHLPPPTVGLLERATFSNVTELRQMAYTDGLGPPLVIIESAINSLICWHLLREDDLYCEFDFAQVLRGDRLREIQALREAIAGGLMKPNEGRGALNLPAEDVDGANRLYLPTNNLSALGEDDALEKTTKADEAAKQQPPPPDDEDDA